LSTNDFLNVSDKKGVLYNITKIFSNHSVSIKRLIQNPTKSKKNSSIVIITHKAKDQNLMKVVKNLSKENYLIKQPKLIRIED
jgi:acetolactate synthase small subunit